MAVPLRIGFQNLADSASLTASSSVGSLSVGNLLTEDIQAIWRAAASPGWVVADLGEAKTVGGVALPNSNALPSDVVRFGVSSSDPTGAARDVYDSGSILAQIDPFRRILTHFIDPGVSGRYVRVDLSQAAAPEAGRIYTGPVWKPTRNVAYGWEPLWRDWSEVTMTRGLNLVRDRRARQNGYSFVLRGLIKAEISGEVEQLNRDKGMSDDILVCLDADDAAATTVWGPMGSMIRAPQPDHNFYVAEFTVWNRL